MQGKYLVGVIGLMYVQNYVVRRLDGSLDETLPLIKSDVLHRVVMTVPMTSLTTAKVQLIDSIRSTQMDEQRVRYLMPQGLQSSQSMIAMKTTEIASQKVR